MQVPTVVSVYDVTAIEHPELTRWLNARHFGFALPRGVHAATRVVVPSEYVKTRLHVVTGVPLHRIVVLPLGVSTEFRPLARELVERRLDGIPGLQQKPFLLSVGNLERKKQLHVLLAAFARIQNRVHANLQLVFAGKAGNAATELETLAMRLGIRESVSFLGYVDRSALVALYSGAEALVYPSLDEGFGLPPLEAMACGTLAVVSTAGALPETTGGCAVSFHTGDDEHLASVLIAAFESEDERARIEARGRMWSAHFSWDEHARGLLHTYYDVARLSVLGSCPNREPAA
jgi:glycosyltransferase involved in cell wall biosynthesis